MSKIQYRKLLYAYLFEKNIHKSLFSRFFFQPIFTESLIGHFLTVFLQVLMHKSHDLLKEEITLTIFHMANVDLNAFFKQFLMDFLNKIEDLDSNQKEKLQMGFKNEVVITFSIFFHNTCHFNLQ